MRQRTLEPAAAADEAAAVAADEAVRVWGKQARPSRQALAAAQQTETRVALGLDQPRPTPSTAAQLQALLARALQAHHQPLRPALLHLLPQQRQLLVQAAAPVAAAPARERCGTPSTPAPGTAGRTTASRPQARAQAQTVQVQLERATGQGLGLGEGSLPATVVVTVGEGAAAAGAAAAALTLLLSGPVGVTATAIGIIGIGRGRAGRQHRLLALHWGPGQASPFGLGQLQPTAPWKLPRQRCGRSPPPHLLLEAAVEAAAAGPLEPAMLALQQQAAAVVLAPVVPQCQAQGQGEAEPQGPGLGSSEWLQGQGQGQLSLPPARVQLQLALQLRLRPPQQRLQRWQRLAPTYLATGAMRSAAQAQQRRAGEMQAVRARLRLLQPLPACGCPRLQLSLSSQRQQLPPARLLHRRLLSTHRCRRQARLALSLFLPAEQRWHASCWKLRPQLL